MQTEDMSTDETDFTEDLDFPSVPSSSQFKTPRNMMDVSAVAAASVRNAVSSRAAAEIATAALVSYGVISSGKPESSGLVIDHKKVDRAKSKIMKEQKTEDLEVVQEKKVECIFFDGRKDKTLVQTEINGRKKFQTVKEEHYSVCTPDGKFLFHFTPEPANKSMSPAESIAKSLASWIADHGLEETLVAVGGDSTNVNTGWKGGAIHYLEVKLGKKLIWLVCMLHTNELPLRHLIISVDGKTSSDTGFTGTLGKALAKATTLPVKSSFESITVGKDLIKLDDNVVNNLSDDQKYGYNMVKAIRSGTVSSQLASLEIGPVNHARWLTTANRFLRLWISENNFEEEDMRKLKLIVQFIVGVYYPMWFSVKVKHSWIEAPRHVLEQVMLVREQEHNVQEIVWPFVASSSWFAHSENILQTLVCSDSEEERQFGVKKILEIRADKEQGDMSVRPRRTPELNTSATSLTNLIYWDRERLHEPPLTCSLTKQELIKLLDHPMKVPYFPCHGQCVERVVKQVTKASAAVHGEERRDGFVRAAEAQRRLVPTRNTKKDLSKMANWVSKKA